MTPPNSKDRAALIVAALCIVALLIWPQYTIAFGTFGALVLFIRLARQWW